MPSTPGAAAPALSTLSPENHAFSALLLAQSVQGERKGPRTRARLRWAACELLETGGLSEVKVADICALGEVAQGTFYQYFADRNVLLGELLQDFVRFLADAMTAAAKQGHSLPESMRISTRTYCVLFSENRGLMRCLLNHYESFPEARRILQEFNRSWLATVADAIERRRPGRRSAASRQEVLRRCYALGGMVDQYLSYVFLAEDPHLVAIAGDIETIAGTLDDIWREAWRKELNA